MYRMVSFGDAAPAPAPQEASATGGGAATSWISGGILVGLAVLMFVVDTKDPLKLKATTR